MEKLFAQPLNPYRMFRSNTLRKHFTQEHTLITLPKSVQKQSGVDSVLNPSTVLVIYKNYVSKNEETLCSAISDKKLAKVYTALPEDA